jgi:serine/threonine protein kinase
VRIAEVEEEGELVTCWDVDEGDALAPGLLAWTFLGGGKYCEAWLAWSTPRWTPVVVKLPRPARVEEERVLRMLAREAELGHSIAHPYVQRLLEADLDARIPHLVLEYVEGSPLDAAIEDDGPMRWEDAALITLQLASVYAHLHGCGYVYLDSKPANVVLRDGRPVLLDLGIARRIGEVPTAGMARGSPPYMAPEQCSSAAADPASDAFGLGALCFELLCGRPPFRPKREGDRWSLPQRYEHAPSVREHAVDPALPDDLAVLVDGLLSHDLGARPSIAETLANLDAVVPPEERLWPSWAGAHVGHAGRRADAPSVKHARSGIPPSPHG